MSASRARRARGLFAAATAVVAGLLLLGCAGAAAANLSAEVEPAPRRAFAAAALDGRVYAAGGWDGQATQLDTVQVLDAQGRWQSAPALNVARSQHALVAARGALWALGGWSATAGLVAPVERYAPGEPAWEIVTRLPTPRREPGAALLGSWLVVAGGFHGVSDADFDGYSRAVEAYDLDTGRWQTLASLPLPRRGLTLVAVEGRLYAVGGYEPDDGFVNAVERYDPASNRWEALAWPLVPRTWAAAVVIKDDIVLIGGYNRSGFLNLVERVNPRTGAVCHPPPLAVPRAWLTAAPLPDGSILTLGGEEEGGIGNTLERLTAQCR